MLRRVILSIIVAVVTGIVVMLIGYGLIEAGVAEVGNFLRGVAVLLGILGGVWYYFVGPDTTYQR